MKARLQPEIRFVDWGMANNFGDYIEIHKDLPKYPNIYGYILKHELAHTDKIWSWRDFKLDTLPSKGLNRLEVYKFMLKRPKTWIQFLPFYYQKDKGLVVDINKCIIWSVLGIFLSIDIYFILTIIKHIQGGL